MPLNELDNQIENKSLDEEKVKTDQNIIDNNIQEQDSLIIESQSNKDFEILSDKKIKSNFI